MDKCRVGGICEKVEDKKEGDKKLRVKSEVTHIEKIARREKNICNVSQSSDLWSGKAFDRNPHLWSKLQ